MRSDREFRVRYNRTTKLLENISSLYELHIICHIQLRSQFSRQSHLPWYSLTYKFGNVRLSFNQITNRNHIHRETMKERLLENETENHANLITSD